MPATVSDLLNFRLDVANKLVNVELLKKEKIRRSKYQDTFIGLVNSSPLESGLDKTDPLYIEVKTEELASFTVLNKNVIDEIKDKISALLHSMSVYHLTDRPDLSLVLEQSRQIIENVKKIPHIEQMRAIRRERETLEGRIRTLIHHSGILSESIAVTSMSSKRTIESMRSCHAILEHMLKKAQQLRGFSRCQKGEKTTVKDTKLAHRIARVRDSLLQLHDTHSKCVEDIATVEDDVAELLSIPPPLMAPFGNVIESIESVLSKDMLKFFEENQTGLLRKLGLNISIDIHDFLSNIDTQLEGAILASSLELDRDNDVVKNLDKIWNLNSTGNGAGNTLNDSD